MSGIACIDPAINNIGLALVRSDPDVTLPYLEKSDLLINQQGLECDEYEERKMASLAIRWLEERNHIWKAVSLVVIEKMIVPQDFKKDFDSVSQLQRACLCFEMVMRTWFKTKFQLGGPMIVVKTAGWWQNENGFVVGQYAHMPRHIAYKILKQRSIETFANSPVVTKNPGTMKHLTTKFGPKLDDVIEAYWISRAAYKNRQQLLEEALTDDTYTHTIHMVDDQIVRRSIRPLAFETIRHRREHEKENSQSQNSLFPVEQHWKRTEQRREEREQQALAKKHRPFLRR
jgi:hypothetical protein